MLKIGGHGMEEPLDAYYTYDNRIKLGAVKNNNEKSFILVNKATNLKQPLKVVINGILEADFFKNKIVEISYAESALRICRCMYFLPSKINGFGKMATNFQSNKPYLYARLGHDTDNLENIVLIDFGGS
jgi:hypothetical protein